MSFNLAAIEELIATTDGTITALAPSSAVLVRAMYTTLSERFRWKCDLQPVDSGDWDAIEAMIAQLYHDLDTAYECPTAGESGMLLPVGAVFAAATAIAPFGALRCDGAYYSAEAYPELFALIDPEYQLIAGEETGFFVPNLSGRVVVGAGGSVVVNSTFGASAHTLTTAELPAHNHIQRYVANSSGSLVGVSGGIDSSSSVPTAMIATGDTGGGMAHNNYQPSLALIYYIVAQTL